MPWSFAALPLAALFAVTRLGAQDPTPTVLAIVAPTDPSDSLAPMERLDGNRLTPGATTYRLSLIRNTGPSPLGTRSVEVLEGRLGNTPAWLVAERRTGTVVPTVDSLWVSRADLAPLRWVATVDRTQLVASFSRDSVFGAMQSYAGRTSFAGSVLPAALVTPGMVERVLGLLPLRVGYRVGASLLLVDQGTPRALPAEIAVEGEERTRGAGGEAECWLVVLRAGALQQRLWVDKTRRIVVRTEQGSSTGRVVAELL